ncbi:MAG: hypothetical protein LBK77_00095 [Spirochaetaceae bacterium]|jgi:hypothetical protein|nr:hypothetical protein [Spirochaetaceae bacterium]
MKKKLRSFCSVVSICALALALSGCFNIFHYITRLDNGSDRHVIKFSVLKSNEAFSPYSDMDPESMNANLRGMMGSMFYDLEGYEQFGGRVESLKKENELGVLVTMDIGYNRETVDRIIKEDTPFVPRYTQDGITIPVQIQAFENNDIMQMSLTGMYRLIISKRCIATLQRAVLTSYPGESPVFQGQGSGRLAPFMVDVLDLGDQYLIEVPFFLLIEDGYKFLKLYSK